MVRFSFTRVVLDTIAQPLQYSLVVVVVLVDRILKAKPVTTTRTDDEWHPLLPTRSALFPVDGGGRLVVTLTLLPFSCIYTRYR